MALMISPQELEIVQQILQKNVPHLEVWAFGSRVKGKARPYSDLDLAIISEEPLDFLTLANLTDDFSDSDLPWKVDILDWATTSEAFREIIREKYEVVKPINGF
ncbi:nucleotidyltransferase [Canicola haemoglobinophilus]|uniref:Nucleotidyltransferase n=1 Tax=Canicola haemoglobinophilus TaxID=733 RepID=A0AB38HB28_9PAST|nr:nucleotidyltransferase domain-containing protein [Canicola haemoglobinophilus]STO55282.1 nucleotidyltransferase [Canicola haemoglobinophilus]STO69148.1 nucleotidyltransferase [Canicola haemoglobinophilus]